MNSILTVNYFFLKSIELSYEKVLCSFSLLIMCHISNNAQGKKYVSRQYLHYDGGSKAEVTSSYAIQITAVEIE